MTGMMMLSDARCSKLLPHLSKLPPTSSTEVKLSAFFTHLCGLKRPPLAVIQVSHHTRARAPAATVQQGRLWLKLQPGVACLRGSPKQPVSFSVPRVSQTRGWTRVGDELRPLDVSASLSMRRLCCCAPQAMQQAGASKQQIGWAQPGPTTAADLTHDPYQVRSCVQKFAPGVATPGKQMLCAGRHLEAAHAMWCELSAHRRQQGLAGCSW